MIKTTTVQWMTTMTTQVPATNCSGPATRAMKSEIVETSEGDDEEYEADGDGAEDSATTSQGGNEDGELFDYIYGSESNDNYVMGEGEGV